MSLRRRWMIGSCVVVAIATAGVLLFDGRRAGDEGSIGGNGASTARNGGNGGAAPSTARFTRLRHALPEPQARVLLLGLDGLDWDFVLPLVDAGAMPNLARLLERGTWGDLKSLSPMLSPLIWTTIATGVSPEVHGILDFVERDRQSGRLIPVTSRSRKVPALWNIASALGRRVDVVGWWGSWPAEEIAGTMVSDRLYYTLVQEDHGAEVLRDTTGVVYPREQARTFSELRGRAVRETGWEELRSFMDVSRATFDHAVTEAGGMGDPIDGFRRILASTRTYLESGLELMKGKPELLMVYLEGTDTIGHLLVGYMPPPLVPDVSPQQAAVYAAAVPRYFAHVDTWLGWYLESCPLDSCVWVLVSDHGFKWGDDRPRGLTGAGGLTAVTEATAPLWHDELGTFVVAGPGIEARGRITEAASVYDVAPSIAALLALPPGTGWRGRTLPGVEAVETREVDYAALLPRQSSGSAVPEGGTADAEALAKLEALGYLGGDTGGGTEESSAGAELSHRELNNLGLLQLDEGRLADAEQTLRRAIALYPDHPYSYVNLNLVLLEQERYDEADRELWRAVERWNAVEEGWREPSALIVAVARSYVDRDLNGRAAALLQRAVQRRPGDLTLWLELLTLRTRLHQCDVGLEESRHAAELFSGVARVQGLYGLMAMCGGEPAEARRALRRSLELDAAQPVLVEALTQLE